MRETGYTPPDAMETKNLVTVESRRDIRWHKAPAVFADAYLQQEVFKSNAVPLSRIDHPSPQTIQRYLEHGARTEENTLALARAGVSFDALKEKIDPLLILIFSRVIFKKARRDDTFVDG